MAPLADITKETERILNEAQAQGVVLRLFGGLAVKFHSPSATHRTLQREYADIDFMGFKKQSKDIKKFFTTIGYTPREVFNALNGDRRLIFQDLENQRRIDIFLDVFEMSHKFDFKDRLLIDKLTISLSDLMATKLQVVEITEREYRDIIALVRDHEMGESDSPETINGRYLASLCSDEWGIYKTFSVNIANILNALPQYKLDEKDRGLVSSRLKALSNMIEKEPKTLRWKLRAKVGEKVQWYELPEGDRKIVTSQST